MNKIKTIAVVILLALTTMLPSAFSLPGQRKPVTVEWDASPDADIAGYRVYTINEAVKTPTMPAGQLTEVGTTLKAVLTFTLPVSALPSGKVPIAVTAYNDAGLESELSNIVYAKGIPGAPLRTRFAAPTP